MPATERQCKTGEIVVHAMNDYGAEAGQCSEFCLIEMAFAFIAAASKGKHNYILS